MFRLLILSYKAIFRQSLHIQTRANIEKAHTKASTIIRLRTADSSNLLWLLSANSVQAMQTATKTGATETLDFVRLFDPKDSATRHFLGQLTILRNLLVTAKHLEQRGQQTLEARVAFLRKSNKPQTDPLSVAVNRDQTDKYLQYASMFALLYRELQLHPEVGTDITLPRLFFARGEYGMFDLQYEVILSVLDAAYAFLVFHTANDFVYDAGNIRQVAAASRRFLSIADRRQIHQSTRKLIGLLRFVLDEVYPHWTMAPPEMYTFPHYSPERVEIVHRWIQAYSLYNKGMIDMLDFGVLENKQNGLDSNSDGMASLGTQKFALAQSAARTFLTACSILSRTPAELEVPLEWPPHSASRLFTLVNGCHTPLQLDDEEVRMRVKMPHDGHETWCQILRTQFLEPVAICFLELKQDAKACVALQIAFDNGNLFVFDDMDYLTRVIKQVSLLPEHNQLLAEIMDTFLVLDPKHQNFHGSSPFGGQQTPLVFG